MDDLHRTANKVFEDAEHLKIALKEGELRLALAAAKRGRRSLTLLVRLLAAERDNHSYTPGGDKQ